MRPQPWELGPVVVRAVPGVLGVFDDRSIGAADRLLADVRQGITDVSGVIPFDWTRSVVVYRGRLIRHELTHVALGRRDDHAPVWLSEGLAEYVSVRPLPPERRGISQSAVDAARAGFADLTSDGDFNDADSRVHYGEAWWACEYVATSFGQATLWSLLDQLDDPDLDDAGRNAGLMAWVGLGTRQLAHRAGRLLLLTFDPTAL